MNCYQALPPIEEARMVTEFSSAVSGETHAFVVGTFSFQAVGSLACPLPLAAICSCSSSCSCRLQTNTSNILWVCVCRLLCRRRSTDTHLFIFICIYVKQPLGEEASSKQCHKKSCQVAGSNGMMFASMPGLPGGGGDGDDPNKDRWVV